MISTHWISVSHPEATLRGLYTNPQRVKYYHCPAGIVPLDVVNAIRRRLNSGVSSRDKIERIQAL